MCEIPSTVLLAEKSAAVFDGFSIGSNDLTQLILGAVFALQLRFSKREQSLSAS